MSVFYIRTCCGFLQNFATGVIYGPNEKHEEPEEEEWLKCSC